MLMPSPKITIDKKNLQSAVARAAEILQSGGVVAFPTESFYGLAVDVENNEAIERIFEIKGREGRNPILILIPSEAALDQYVAHVPEAARSLIKKFWPGGLTLVFEAKPGVSPLLTAGLGKIGIRLSSHPVATALAKTTGRAISGTSANLSGQPAFQTAAEAESLLGDKLDLILDGGKTSGGRGSTVLDVTADPPAVLREGMISREELKEIIPF